MREPPIPVTPEQVLPEEKQFLTEEQLYELWDLRGLKYRVDSFHVSLLSRGLNVSVDRAMFRSAVYDILKSFLIDGDARLPDKNNPLPRFPKVY